MVFCIIVLSRLSPAQIKSIVKIEFQEDRSFPKLDNNFKFYYYEDGKKVTPKIAHDTVYLPADVTPDKLISVCFEYQKHKVRFDAVKKSTLTGTWNFMYIKDATQTFIADGDEDNTPFPYYYVAVIQKDYKTGADLKEIDYFNGNPFK
jgi:hypothetical protein